MRDLNFSIAWCDRTWDSSLPIAAIRVTVQSSTLLCIDSSITGPMSSVILAVIASMCSCFFSFAVRLGSGGISIILE